LGGNICRCGPYLGIVAVVVEQQNELIHRTLPARWPPHLQNIIAAGRRYITGGTTLIDFAPEKVEQARR
jgi:hypothetical protein